MDLGTRKKSRNIGRRKVLLGAAGVLALLGSVVSVVRTRGYELDDAREKSLVALSPWQFVVVRALARRIAAPDDPADSSIPTPDDVDVAGFVDAYVAGMHPILKRDLLRLLGFVEQIAPIGAGFSSRFTKLGPEEQDKVLSWLEENGQGLLRGAFDALKSLVFMGYYRDPRTWKILGYEGPFVNRPERGWY